MAFYVGQEVVCIDASNYYLSGAPVPLSKNSVYVVAEDHGWAINLVGLGSGQMAAFHNKRFRPVEKRKTDISVLEALLLPANHKVLEDA